MLNIIYLLMSVTLLTLGVTSLSVKAQTIQEASQNTVIEGNENQVNQVINQYYFKNPGKGAIRRQNSPSAEINQRTNNRNNREWGHSQGASQKKPKK
ncbi:hypothetical protein PCC7418_0809 [Halothece sp. PCC 7418]|uniref:hypothetical protein n=1 Tax=Halothece sp. (strain PCC 7418) TaxID=65093 RepID=UPI0002A07E7B|nr:hypothetical protein [Halothece sp. PCC 7418]AFZ43024.1 hypothetical protein PCC7418_0809 [Halothece sp. PCC 7418]